jgi:acyl-CoA thioesterase FadM
MCHLAYESFMESVDYGLGKILDQGKIGLPIVHIEGDFKNPLSVGDKIEIILEVGGVGRSSFRINYKLVSLSGKVYSTASTTHVCVNPRTKRSMDIPEDLRAILKSY